MNRLTDRNNMMKRHNDRLDLAQRIGIKIKTPPAGNSTFNNLNTI